MSSSTAIKIVSPDELNPGTAETPGSERRAAIAPALGVSSATWGGPVRGGTGIADGSSSSRRARDDRLRPLRHLRNTLGDKGRIGRAREGRRFHSRPASLPHMETNPSKLERLRWVVVRSTATPIIVNLPDDPGRKPESSCEQQHNTRPQAGCLLQIVFTDNKTWSNHGRARVRH
jgi:hypothetical protein